MLGFSGHRKQGGTTIGVAFAADGVAVGRIRPATRGAPPRLDSAAWLPAADPAAAAHQLEAFVDGNSLGGCAVVGVLAHGEYQVVPVEAPNVPPAEMRQAAGWRVRELIDFPLDEAIIDTYEPPADARRGPPMVNVVVARRDRVAERISLLERSDLRPTAIDIPELVQRNISARLPAARGGHALLALDDLGGLVTVFRDGNQYFARSLDTGRAALAGDNAEALDALMLEVQRSFDYYESALSQPPLGALYIYPGGGDDDALVDRMAEGLASAQCRAIGLADVVAVDAEPGNGRATLLHAVGAGLRQPEGQS